MKRRRPIKINENLVYPLHSLKELLYSVFVRILLPPCLGLLP